MSRSIFSISRSSISRSLIVVAASLATIFVSNTNLHAAAAKSQAQRDQAREQANLVKEVHHQLVMLPYLTVFDNLEYKVDGTKVTLMGQVTRPSLKEDAGRAVKSVEGVTEVDNQIQALPPSPMDDQIRHAEFRAIYGFPSLSRYSWGAIPQIHIVVDSGHVTLYGIVDNQADKDTAGLRANTVPNVFSVTNNLQVAGPGK
jgi:hyperosmotically inducible periplasmic protein